MLRFVERVAVVGCGGIGSWLLGPLLRFLDAEGARWEIHLWDGDRYAPENLARQEFSAGSVGGNKAEVQAEAYRDRYPAHRLVAHGEYVGPGNVRAAVPERSLVLTCVDNHPARALLDRRAGELRDVCVLSAGNEEYDGNVHVTLRRNGRPLTAPLLDRHPEIGESTRGDRLDLGCAERIAQGETQYLVTNFLAAAAAMQALHLLWTHGRGTGRRRAGVPQELYFDAAAGSMALLPAQAAGGAGGRG